MRPRSQVILLLGGGLHAVLVLLSLVGVGERTLGAQSLLHSR